MFSLDRIAHIRKRLEAIGAPETVSIAAVGSLARLEASPQSDMDYIVLSTNDHPELRNILNKLASEVGLMQPNPQGVFNENADLNDLVERIGRADDSFENMSRRILLLLESVPLWNDSLLEGQISGIVNAYLFRKSESISFSFLLNDINRYFRTICVNNEATSRVELHKWAIRSVKLKHSRIIMYCGLLFLVAYSSGIRREDAYNWLRTSLKLCPLDRIAKVYVECGDPGFTVVATAYETFLNYISDPSTRDHLSRLPYHTRYTDVIFLEFERNSRKLTDELYRFLFTHRHAWGSKFLSRLIF